MHGKIEAVDAAIKLLVRPGYKRGSQIEGPMKTPDMRVAVGDHEQTYYAIILCI